jgi:hypothetical protein
MIALLMTLVLGAEPAVSGTFQIEQTPTQLDAVHGAAVQKTLDNLPWALRGLARGPVSKTVDSCTQLAIDLDASQLTLQCDDKADVIVERPSDNRQTVSPDGESVTVNLTTSDSELGLSMASARGGVATRYVVEGDRLRVIKSLFSDRLPTPTVWEVAYNRTATP